MQCPVTDCPNPATRSWQRYATEDERAALIAAGEIGPDDTPVLLPMVGCTDHKLNRELAAATHQATCTAPPATPIVYGPGNQELSGGLCNCSPDHPSTPEE